MFFNNMFVSNTATTSNADENFALGVALLVESGRLFCFVIFHSNRLVLIVHVPSVACVIAARALELFGEITVQQALRKWTDSIYPPPSQGLLAVVPPPPPPPTRRCENAADISALEVERDIMRQQRPSVQYQPSTGFRLTSTHMHPANRASSGLVCLGQASKCWHDATKLIAAEPVHWDGLPAHRQRTLVHLRPRASRGQRQQRGRRHPAPALRSSRLHVERRCAQTELRNGRRR
jgi:hypothetical protein